MAAEPGVEPAEMYERFFVPAIFGPWTQELLDRARPRPGERVLDVACGTGIVARHVARLVGAEGSVTGVDLQPGMLEVARSAPRPGGAEIRWEQASADGLPFPPSSFDLVLCQQGLQRVTATARRSSSRWSRTSSSRHRADRAELDG